MGIQGLLPMLKEAQSPIHIREWKGKTLAVDAYVWLHRGAYGCAEDLALGKPTTSYVKYSMHRVRMLKHYGVTPLIVFDGGLLPSKMGTEGERERRRSDALAKGTALLAENKKAQAREHFVKAVDVTPEMAFQLIKALRLEGVKYIVAPYEADPQLAYLERQGIVDGIVTEDSDLLVFGCQNVIFKLDGEGNCVHVKRADFTRCKEYNFAGWTDKEFRQMAILSGCDYVQSIVGIGLKKAYALMRKYKSADRAIQSLRVSGRHTIPRDYQDHFTRAELTFCHQRVFDPVSKSLVHLEPLPAGVTADDMPFVGGELDVEYVRALAIGDIDPISKRRMVDLNPDAFSPKAPYVPSTFKATKSKNSANPAINLLNFFNRLPAQLSASTTKMPLEVTISHAKPRAERVPELQSKFFGGTTVSEELQDIEDVAEGADESWNEEALDYYEELEAQDRDAEEDFCDFDMLGDTADHPVLPVKRGSSVVSISSPAATPPRVAKRRKFDLVAESPEGHVDLERATDGAVSSPPGSHALSSPEVPSPTTRPFKPEAVSVMAESHAVAADANSHSSPWSDPIGAFSESDMLDGDVVTSTLKSHKGKGRKSDVKGPLPKIKKEKSRSLSSSSSSPRDIPAQEESEAIASITATWRAKFLHQPKSKTPIINNATRITLPTPTSAPHSQLRIAPAPPAIARKPPRNSYTSYSSTPARLPLSPKKLNVPSPPSPEKPAGQLGDVQPLKPTVITNRRLLAFKFNGA